MTKVYKFRCALLGHSGDVRCLMCPDDQHILSASRDFTARVWLAPNDGPDILLGTILRGHENYVAAVTAYMLSDNTLMVFTGSNDKIIRAYAPDCTEPTFYLKGHEDTVCALAVDSQGTLVSGSWDKSVKIWKDKECVLTIRGHEAAIWCVLIIPSSSISVSTESDFIVLTGSADHLISVWSITGMYSSDFRHAANHTLLKTLRGHADCVRSLAQVDNCRILSASNDASIRGWDLTSGQCIGEFYGHTNFVYSVATRPESVVFVSSGEDRCVRVWTIPAADEWGPGRQFTSLQCIPLPCQSVWCVALTSMFDIVVGGSDFVIRVFSSDPTRQASDDVIQTYEAELSSAKIASANTSATGDLDPSKLPGIEALLQPGKREGQIIVIQQDGRSVCYQWSMNDTRWLEIGDVVGTGSPNTHVFNGKEYDFVFSVDISESMEPLKLPYNRTEDPWFVAQRFIHEHDLPQGYLDQVAQFIIRNAGPPLASTTPDNTFCDPFTGTQRYIPGSSTASTLYSLPYSDVVTERYFPVDTFMTLKSLSLTPLLAKLETFNLEEQYKIDSTHFDLLRSFTFDLPETHAVDLTTVILDTVVQWPAQKIFPLLDVLRCLVFWPQASTMIFSPTRWKQLYAATLGHTDLSHASCLLMLRLLANAMAADGPTYLSHSNASNTVPNSLLTSIGLAPELGRLIDNAQLNISERKPHQIALSILIHNLSVFCHLSITTMNGMDPTTIPHLRVIPSLCLRFGLRLLSLAPQRGPSGVTLFHPDATFTLLLAVGTALLTASHHSVDTTQLSDERVKAHRVRLMASAASANGLLESESTVTAEDELATWEDVRRMLVYWADTPTCVPKIRTCATALLHMLE